jgi:NitT/TauT family transport system substrate-binding protein
MLAYVSTRMEECGKSADSINRVETGFGVSSAEALDSGSIDAFVGYPTLFVGYSNAGYNFRRLAPAEWQTGFYGTGFAAKTSYMAEHPEVIEKFSRVMAKSAVYIRANPEDAVRALWAANPAAAPKTETETAEYMKRDLAVLAESMNMMRVDEFPPEFAWGSQDAETWQRHLDKLKATDQIPQDFAGVPEDYFTDEFSAGANSFDRKALIDMALAAK